MSGIIGGLLLSSAEQRRWWRERLSSLDFVDFDPNPSFVGAGVDTQTAAAVVSEVLATTQVDDPRIAIVADLTRLRPPC